MIEIGDNLARNIELIAVCFLLAVVVWRRK